MFFSHRRSCCVALAPLLLASACFAAPDRASSVAGSRTTASARALAPADTDDFGAPLPTDATFAARVVSLNPTATEIIFALGEERRLVGRSKWDEYPSRVTSVPSVGDGIRPNVEAVLGVHPTLVILYATAENRQAARTFTDAGVRTVALRVDRIAQFVSLTQLLGRTFGVSQRATQVVDSVMASLERVRAMSRATDSPTVVWPLWQSPVMVVGRGSYLNELIEIAGAHNVFADLDAPSPTVSIEEIARRDPKFVIASPETAKRLSSMPAWRAVRAVREGRIILDDSTLSGRPSVVLGMAAHHLAVSLRAAHVGKQP